MMKKILFSALILLFFFVAKAQTDSSSPKVDERVELVSIVARLADYEEYSANDNKLYVADIHRYFDQYKDHPLIKFMRGVRSTNSIGFDAVMAIAVHLTPPPALNPIVKFTKTVPDERWGADSAAKFETLLKQFYKQSNFEQFYKDHQHTYQTAETNFMNVYKLFDIDWYYKYYGVRPKQQFNVVIGIGNGGGNYGPKVIYPNGKETVYAIMGSWQFDSLGMPNYTKESHLPTLIHEFNHSFVNYLTDKNEGRLATSGNIIYRAVSEQMQKQAYGDWQTMMSEALVRASVIRYLKVHETDSAIVNKDRQQQLSRGFVWIPQLVDLLGTYEANRQTYPTLESFMPQIINFYSKVATNINLLKSEYQKTLVHVSSMDPFPNQDTTVSPLTKQIKIAFDRVLSGKGSSINFGEMGKEHFPITKFIGYADNNKSIILEVTLKPDFEYQFVLTGRSFQTSDGHPLAEYSVHFKTSK